MKLPRISWVQTSIVLFTHAVGITGSILYGIHHGFTWTAVGIALAFFVLGAFSISGGYHRLFSHGAYQAHWTLRLFYAIFGAAALEGSVLVWSGIHRKHHLHTDTDEDPHNVKRSFWWAHVGWVMFTDPGKNIQGNVDDLRQDPILRFQDRYYIFFAVIFGILAPWGLGYLLGDHWGGLLVGGFLRIIVFHHITWFINSAAHTFGTQPYSKATTARDSVMMALLTMGEGYHNYHHAFAFDYRNGVRRLAFDPSKWMIFLLSKIGITYNLIRAQEESILRALAENR